LQSSVLGPTVMWSPPTSAGKRPGPGL
jgi:hypothetical protein